MNQETHHRAGTELDQDVAHYLATGESDPLAAFQDPVLYRQQPRRLAGQRGGHPRSHEKSLDL